MRTGWRCIVGKQQHGVRTPCTAYQGHVSVLTKGVVDEKNDRCHRYPARLTDSQDGVIRSYLKFKVRTSWRFTDFDSGANEVLQQLHACAPILRHFLRANRMRVQRTTLHT